MACFKRTICPIREGKRTWIKRTTAGQKLEIKGRCRGCC